MLRISYFTDRLARRIPQVPEGLQASVPVSYEDDPTDQDAKGLGVAEGQSFMIEYVNSSGAKSSRRITVFNIVAGAGGVPCLMARCHERKATRQFRIDRIVSCIDFNGEVFDDVPSFLVDTFGMDSAIADRRKDEKDDREWKAIVEFIRPMAVLLAAVARSDGLVRTVELETAAQRLASIAERNDCWVEVKNFERLVTYIRRLRPGDEAISRALRAISVAKKDDVILFFRAAVAVMKADGVQHPDEIAMINEMSREIVGVDVLS